jgi:hypothetical protein
MAKMTTTGTAISNAKPLITRHPQAVAWSVLLISFVLFLFTCAASTFGVWWFFFESRIDLKANLFVGRGSLRVVYGVDPSLIGGRIAIEQDAVIRADETSQGYLTFEDNYSDQTIATIFLLPNSTLRLDERSRPRFDWSSNSYVLNLADITGQVIVEVPPDVTRKVTLTLGTAFGEAQIDQSGVYRLEVADSQLYFYTQTEGRVALVRNVLNQTYQVAAPLFATLDRTTQNVVVQPLPYLILTPEFRRPRELEMTAQEVVSDPNLPMGWACAIDPIDDISRQEIEPDPVYRRAVSPDGRVVLRLFRGEAGVEDNKLGHAEVGCLHNFGGIEVTRYTSLSIEARFRIGYQDLTTCGDLGTECPVMLALTYESNSVDANGQPTTTEYVWRHGFYIHRPDGDARPVICDTCLQVHDRIVGDVWYNYDSGDLFKLLTPDRRPVKLKEIRVYASGHVFDMMMESLRVVVGTVN